MKHLVLTMAAAALMCSQSATAQNRVKNLYTETQTLKVEQVMDCEQTTQLNRYFMAGYNTLCLPMSLSAEQIEAAAKGLRVERLEAIRQEGNTLCLYFVECTNEGIEAGMPYIVFSPTAQYMRVRNTDAKAVSTELQTVRMTDNQGNQVSFSSSWNIRYKEGLFGIPAKQNVAVLESILISTTADQSFLPTRCGFCWEEKSSTASNLEIKHASAAEVTAIRTVSTDSKTTSTDAYDLNGRRVSSSAKGIVIQNGRKVVVK